MTVSVLLMIFSSRVVQGILTCSIEILRDIYMCRSVGQLVCLLWVKMCRRN